ESTSQLPCMSADSQGLSTVQMEYELRRRVRRTVETQLRPLGLWPERHHVERFTAQQRWIGYAVCLRTLPKTLGAADFGRVMVTHGNTAAGGDLPFMAAFGQTYSLALHRLAGTGDSGMECADACSLF